MKTLTTVNPAFTTPDRCLPVALNDQWAPVECSHPRCRADREFLHQFTAAAGFPEAQRWVAAGLLDREDRDDWMDRDLRQWIGGADGAAVWFAARAPVDAIRLARFHQLTVDQYRQWADATRHHDRMMWALLRRGCDFDTFQHGERLGVDWRSMVNTFENYKGWDDIFDRWTPRTDGDTSPLFSTVYKRTLESDRWAELGWTQGELAKWMTRGLTVRLAAWLRRQEVPVETVDQWAGTTLSSASWQPDAASMVEALGWSSAAFTANDPAVPDYWQPLGVCHQFATGAIRWGLDVDDITTVRGSGERRSQLAEIDLTVTWENGASYWTFDDTVVEMEQVAAGFTGKEHPFMRLLDFARRLAWQCASPGDAATFVQHTKRFGPASLFNVFEQVPLPGLADLCDVFPPDAARQKHTDSDARTLALQALTMYDPSVFEAEAVAAAFDPHSDSAWRWALGGDANATIQWKAQWRDGAVSAKDWYDAGIPPPAALRWHRYGFGPTDTRRWEHHGFQCNHAASWRDAGFSPASAAAWRDAGFNNPSAARRWCDFTRSPSIAERLAAAGATVRGCQAFLAAGWTKDDVVRFAAAGVTRASSVRRWAGRNVDEVLALMGSQPSGSSPVGETAVTASQ